MDLGFLKLIIHFIAECLFFLIWQNDSLRIIIKKKREKIKILIEFVSPYGQASQLRNWINF